MTSIFINGIMIRGPGIAIRSFMAVVRGIRTDLIPNRSVSIFAWARFVSVFFLGCSCRSLNFF